jgi:hypothetical protein
MDDRHTSHYDPAANVCYVMFEDMYRSEKPFAIADEMIVQDAFEGRTYADFMQSLDAKVEECMVSPPDKKRPDSFGPTDDCPSYLEFKAQVFMLYGISQ